jgi:hypothetical protein
MLPTRSSRSSTTLQRVRHVICGPVSSPGVGPSTVPAWSIASHAGGNSFERAPSWPEVRMGRRRGRHPHSRHRLTPDSPSSCHSMLAAADGLCPHGGADARVRLQSPLRPTSAACRAILCGTGRPKEHLHPHLVASWEGSPPGARGGDDLCEVVPDGTLVRRPATRDRGVMARQVAMEGRTMLVPSPVRRAWRRLRTMIDQFRTGHEDLRAVYGENPNRKRDQERQSGIGRLGGTGGVSG